LPFILRGHVAYNIDPIEILHARLSRYQKPIDVVALCIDAGKSERRELRLAIANVIGWLPGGNPWQPGEANLRAVYDWLAANDYNPTEVESVIADRKLQRRAFAKRKGNQSDA